MFKSKGKLVRDGESETVRKELSRASGYQYAFSKARSGKHGSAY